MLAYVTYNTTFFSCTCSTRRMRNELRLFCLSHCAYDTCATPAVRWQNIAIKQQSGTQQKTKKSKRKRVDPPLTPSPAQRHLSPCCLHYTAQLKSCSSCFIVMLLLFNAKFNASTLTNTNCRHLKQFYNRLINKYISTVFLIRERVPPRPLLLADKDCHPIVLVFQLE